MTRFRVRVARTRGVGAGRSAQRGTSAATTGPRGARSAPPNPERVCLLHWPGLREVTTRRRTERLAGRFFCYAIVMDLPLAVLCRLTRKGHRRPTPHHLPG